MAFRYPFVAMAIIFVQVCIFSCLKLLTSFHFLCLTWLPSSTFSPLIHLMSVTSKPFGSLPKIFSIFLQMTVESFPLFFWSLTLSSNTGVFSTFSERLCLCMTKYTCRYPSFCMSKSLQNQKEIKVVETFLLKWECSTHLICTYRH